MTVKSENQVKYLGLIIDSNLNWKAHIHELNKTISRGIGYYVNKSILQQLYYSLISPFLTYGLSVWGNTYNTTLRPLLIIKTIYIIIRVTFPESFSLENFQC